MPTIVLAVKYTIKDKKLSTDVVFPESFLLAHDMVKVQLLSALIDLLNNRVMPDMADEKLPCITTAHALIVAEAAVLFPLRSAISLYLAENDNIKMGLGVLNR